MDEHQESENENEVVEVPEFEGRPITSFEVILPRVTVDAPELYVSGNILRLATELRIADVKYKDNGDSTWTRQHILAWESVEVVSAFDPADQILDGGSSSSTRGEVDESDELGVALGRSGEAWPENVSQFPRRDEAMGE